MNALAPRLPILTALCVSLSLGSISTAVQATPITMTGEDLFNSPQVSFQTTTPTLNGTSLAFGSGAEQFGKLFEIPLFPTGFLSSSSPAVEISVSMNLTRLPCVGACVGGSADWDPHILLSDSSSLVGPVIADNIGGEALATEMTDLGNVGQRNVLTSVFTGAGYPVIGEAFDVDVLFTLDNLLTTVDVAFLSGSTSFTSTRLDRTASLSFVFMRDNDIGEQYQVNSITIDSVSVPEPATLLLMLMGLAGIGLRGKLHSPSDTRSVDSLNLTCLAK